MNLRSVTLHLLKIISDGPVQIEVSSRRSRKATHYAAALLGCAELFDVYMHVWAVLQSYFELKKTCTLFCHFRPIHCSLVSFQNCDVIDCAVSFLFGNARSWGSYEVTVQQCPISLFSISVLAAVDLDKLCDLRRTESATRAVVGCWSKEWSCIILRPAECFVG